VLELLAQGLLATSIASRLSLSPRTVHKHLGNIYDKLGVHDRLVAVSLARSRYLVPDPAA
jgi:DNA-binding NarL/FixJ family response regulator